MAPWQMENGLKATKLITCARSQFLSRSEFIPNSKAKHLISTLSFYTSTSQGHPGTVKFKCFPLREFWKAYICSKYLIYSSYDQCTFPNLTKQPSCRKVWKRTQKWHGTHPWQLAFHFRRPTKYFLLLLPQCSCSNIFFQKSNTQNCALNRQNKIYSLIMIIKS